MTAPRLRPGAAARVSVPGSSANLGPGFDSLGLALAIRDEIEVRVLDTPGVQVEIDGAGAGAVPRDESHLVVRSIRAAIAALGIEQPGLWLRCRNAVPHGRGVGSSAAAIVAGVSVVRGLLEDPAAADDDFVLQLATELEGHPDNAAASLFGSAVIGWMDGDRARAVIVPTDPNVRAVICVPEAELSTARARAMLPGTVPHHDAAFTAGRAALLVEALSRRPELLLEATEDRLHQHYRAPAMPETARLLLACREAGLAATVSGAGPSVLVLGADEALLERVGSVAGRLSPSWHVHDPGIDTDGVVVEAG